MKVITIISFCIFTVISCFGQIDNSKIIVPYFTCSSDSVTYYFFKDNNHIKEDTVIRTKYSTYHDIGDKSGISKNYIFIKLADNTQVRIIEGCRMLENDTTYIIEGTEIFDYYFENNLGKIEKPINSWLSQSHDSGFYTEIYIKGKNVNEVNIKNHQLITKPGEEPDKRVSWVRLIREKVKCKPN